MEVKEGILLGMGNPLLDISATVKPALLAKHNLKSNDAILTEDEQIFKDLQDGYKDKSAQILEEKAQEVGVKPVYQKVAHPTGRCAVLITGNDRSLVTKLDAANHFTVSHLENSANWEVVTAAQTVYSAGFFLTVSVDSMIKVGKFCAETNRTYCLNLSAPFLIQFFKQQMMSVMPYADIVFGNETEALTFAEVHDLPTRDIREIAKRISMLPKENGSKGRLVIITQGSDPVVCVHQGKALEFPAEKLQAQRIVDTNGAGDAFVGGFLAQYVQNRPLDVAIRCGIWAATHIIQRSGCTLPDKMDFCMTAA